MISKSSNIARRAKRVVDVAEAEMENSLDPDYVAKMAAAKDNLGQCRCFIHKTAQKNFFKRLQWQLVATYRTLTAIFNTTGLLF